MTETSGTTELDRLIIGSERREPLCRNRAIAIAVAAIALVAAVVTWWPGADQAEQLPPPAEPVVQLNASEQFAGDFVAAYAAFDRDLMASYLAGDAYLTMGTPYGDDGWILYNRYDEAIGTTIEPKRCYQTQALQPDGAQVGCLFSYHAFGSKELGRGPFRDGHFNITVHNGHVSDAAVSWAETRSGYNKVMVEPVAAWLEKTYPDAQTRDAWKDPEATAAEIDESFELWSRLISEYVAAVKAGEAK